MPNYQYKCFSCGYEFERDHAIDNRYLPTYEKCPECMMDRSVQKLMSLTSFRIKGASSKNGFSSNIGDMEKSLGRPITNEDIYD